jgi:2-polyprenyl-3-methyl-5-hydroxy-6-metoxy-1,4-benzoquinol methylase
MNKDNLSTYNSDKFTKAYISQEQSKFDIYKDFLFQNLKSLPKNSKIIDLGCGTGLTAHEMSQKGFIVTGVDFSEKFINYATQKYRNKNLNFKVMDIEDLNGKLKNKNCDCITSFNVILHIPLSKLESHFNQIGES